jgi:hypothetical protein
VSDHITNNAEFLRGGRRVDLMECAAHGRVVEVLGEYRPGCTVFTRYEDGTELATWVEQWHEVTRYILPRRTMRGVRLTLRKQRGAA